MQSTIEAFLATRGLALNQEKTRVVSIDEGFNFLGFTIRKFRNGKLLIMPKLRKKWPSGFLESFGNMPSDFEAPARPPANVRDNEKDSKLFDDE